MKKEVLLKEIFLMCQLCFICLFSSCENEDVSYSCDKTIDTWVKENMSEVQSMNNADFLSLDVVYQKAIYTAFTPMQRERIWIEKFEEALKLDWTVKEREHLNNLLLACNAYSDIFIRDVPEERKDKFKVWAYKWAKDATEQLRWTPKLVNSMLVVPGILLNKEGDIKESSNVATRIKLRTEVGDKCNCSSISGNVGEGMIWDDCKYQCIKGYWDCKVNWGGCGLFMLDTCDGYCW